MNTSISSRAALLLLPALGLLLTAGSLHAQSGEMLSDAIVDARLSSRMLDTLPLRATRSRLPEMPVGAARSVETVMEGGTVTALTVIGATGVAQRLWIPGGMVLYNESIEIADSDNDGIAEVTAAGAHGGRVGRCTWSYRPTVERYSSRARIDFPVGEEEETEE